MNHMEESPFSLFELSLFIIFLGTHRKALSKNYTLIELVGIFMVRQFNQWFKRCLADRQ